MAQRLAGNLSWFWNFSGRLQEGQVWLEAAVEWQGTHTLGFARATYGAGVLAFLRGDVGAARRRLEQSLVASESLTLAGGEDARAAQALKGYALCVLAMNHTNAGELEVAVRTAEQSVAAFEAYGDAWDAALGHNDLGTVLLRAGDRFRASAALEASLEAWNEIGDSWGVALVLTNIATLHYSLLDRDDPTRDPARARRYMERALHLQLRDGDLWGAAVSHLVLGGIARAEGDLARATARYLESLERNEQVDRPSIVAILLDRLAAVATGNGDGHRAALLFGAAMGYRQRRGIPLVRRQELLRNSDVELARGLLPPKEWQQALAWGERTTLEEATRAADPAVPVSTGGVAAAS